MALQARLRIWPRCSKTTFSSEIDRRGEIIPTCAYLPFASQMLDTITPPSVVVAPCLLDIYSSTVDAISKVATGKATGPDLIPVELSQGRQQPALFASCQTVFPRLVSHRAAVSMEMG